MRNTESRDPTNEGGFVLLAVLLFLGLISALAVHIMATSLSMSRESAARSTTSRHILVLDAALNRAIHALENPDDRLLRVLRSSSTGASWQFDGTDVRVELSAESGKLDLNTADLPLLRSVIERLFTDDPAIADSIANRLAEWRQQGRRFEFVEAVLSGADRLRDPVEAVRRSFTVVTGQAGFDPSSASELLLKALPGQSPQGSADLLAARSSGRLASVALSAQMQSLIVRERPIYTVGAELASSEIYARREAVVLIEPNSQAARVLSWRSIVKPLPRQP